MMKKDWKEFKDSGLLWWVNRILHLFGWSIVIDIHITGEINEVYPARVQYRGFDLDAEERGFTRLTKYLNDNSELLLSEMKNEMKEGMKD